MMPSCRLASELRSQIPQVFQVTSHIVGLVVLCAEMPIHLLSMHQTCSLLTCTRIPCRGSRCENGRVTWWCSHTRRLQQTAVSSERSNCNKSFFKKKKNLKVDTFEIL